MEADPWQGLQEDLHQQWEREKMGRYASEKGGSFKSAPVGTHVARCIKLIDLGTQTNDYKGKITHPNQVLVMFELPNELMETDEGQKPFIISKFYTNSLNEKATLRHDLEAWRSKAFTEEELDSFDLMNILTKPCMLSVVEKEKGGTKIGSVSALPKGMTCPPQFNVEEAFWLDEFNEEQFDAIPKGIQDIIKKSPEYKAAIGEKVDPIIDMDDDIPF